MVEVIVISVAACFISLVLRDLLLRRAELQQARHVSDIEKAIVQHQKELDALKAKLSLSVRR